MTHPTYFRYATISLFLTLALCCCGPVSSIVENFDGDGPPHFDIVAVTDDPHFWFGREEDNVSVETNEGEKALC